MKLLEGKQGGYYFGYQLSVEFRIDLDAGTLPILHKKCKLEIDLGYQVLGEF